MNNWIKTYGIIFSLIVLLTACGKNFLSETSQDLVRPTTVESLEQIMMGEAYPVESGSAFHIWLEVLTDDIQSDFANTPAGIANTARLAPFFIWSREMFEQSREQANPESYNCWTGYYRKIKGCNVVLDKIDEVSGDPIRKGNVKAQALALRGYYYFMLVNLFGKPYGASYANAEEDLAVPLVLSAEVSDNPIPRSTVARVYEQIEADLAQARILFQENPISASIFKFSEASVLFLQSRIHLYKKEWQQAVASSNAALEKNGRLTDLSGLTATSFAINDVVNSPEIYWGYGTNSDYTMWPFGTVTGFRAAYSTSDELVALYETGDQRLRYWFRNIAYNSGGTFITYRGAPAKNPQTSTSSKAFRTAELLLNRAEANTMLALQGNTNAVTLALQDINDLRRRRFVPANFQPITTTDPNQLLTFIRLERRRELCWEEHRWFDLRRWETPNITHRLQLNENTIVTETLQPNDPRYTLPVPLEAINRNPALVPNP